MLQQLWLFWVAPIAGGLIAGFVYKFLSPEEKESVAQMQPSVEPIAMLKNKVETPAVNQP